MLLKNRELRLALCSRLARRYSEWKAVVLREKAIYHVLNLFRADVSGMLRGEGWIVASAEKLPIANNSFDFYTISFGLRNTKNIDKSIKEAFRVLKPGGKFLCLEFSKVQNENFRKIYEGYSKLIPKIGDFIVGEKEPYEYLVESIDKFINQEELLDCMNKNSFTNCKYRNLNGGIVAIHSGWKV